MKALRTLALGALATLAPALGHAQLSTYTYVEGQVNVPTLLTSSTYILPTDQEAVSLPLPFTFFFGNLAGEDTLHVAENGYAFFGKASAHVHTSTPLIDYATNPMVTGVIAPFATELAPFGGGNIKFETAGTAPFRVFTVEWQGYSRADQFGNVPVGDKISFRINLLETFNSIEVIFTQTVAEAAFTDVSEVQVGIMHGMTGEYSLRKQAWNGSSAGTALNDFIPTQSTTSFPEDGFRMAWKTNTPVSTLQLITPNGGEVWSAGTTQNIVWTSTGIANLMILYSIDTGASWTPINMNAPAAPGSYSWNIPSWINSTTCIMALVDTVSGNFAMSAGTFTIQQSAAVPTVYFTNPTGGEYYDAGLPLDLQFTANLVSNVTILFTTDNWVTDTVLVANHPTTTGMYTFNIPANINSASCGFMIYDSSDPSVADVTGLEITITPPAGVGVEEGTTTLVKVYPNPAQDRITIQPLQGAATVEILDITGSVLIKEQTTGEAKTMSIGHLPAGMYLVRAQANDKTSVQRLIKN